MRPTAIKVVSREEEVALIARVVESLGDGIVILEAGCGRKWPLALSNRFKLIGVDQDETALRARAEALHDLDEYRVGSLGDVTFEPRSFDVIYCSYVLEHVLGVEKVLANFATWIRPGGLIVLRVPDATSVYGFCAKHTPHWLHVLVKRYVYGRKNAGKPGHDPYPVFYEHAMSPTAIARFCERHGFEFSVTGNGKYLQRRWWMRPAVAAVSWLSLGSLAWRHNNLTFLIHT